MKPDEEINIEFNESTDQRDSDTEDEHLDPTISINPSDSIKSLTGSSIGDYQVLELIGAGGGGKVYKAQHEHMGRIVAIKVLPQEMVANPLYLKRFHREVRAAAKLLHPNIVTAFDAGNVGDTHYLVMEYVEGESLVELIRREGPLSIKKAIQYTILIARGLEHAHSQALIHRDIKPANVMLDQSQQVKILDMGLAQLQSLTLQGQSAEEVSKLTIKGSVLGTVGYMSPEQISNSHDVDLRTDIYSLGCTLFHLLVGHSPFAGSTIETLVAHVNVEAPGLAEFRKDIPADLEAIYKRMVTKDPRDRQSCMQEVITSLERLGELSSKSPVVLAKSEKQIVSQGPKDRSDSQIEYVQKAVGFAYGTKNSYVSWVAEDGLPILVENSQGDIATPSAIKFNDGSFACGQAALADVERDIKNLAEHLKQQLGSPLLSRTFAGREFPAEVLCAISLAHLAAETKKKIGYFSHLVYTVPGCFGDSKRQAFQDAFYIAGLNTLQPLNSATAVAINFSFVHGWLNPRRDSQTKRLLVFRLGAGSFDATVFRIKDQHVTAVATAGDSQLGGSNWDDRLVRCVVDQLSTHQEQDVSNDNLKLYLLRNECEKAKIALTEQERVTIRVQTSGMSFEGTLSPGFVRKLSTDLLEKVESLLNQAIKAAGIKPQSLDHIILTGGTSQMPVVRNMVENWSSMPGKCTLAGPEAAPAGAALFAQMQIMGDQPTFDLRVQDISTRAIGFTITEPQSGKHHTKVLISKNTPLPTISHAKLVITQQKQQSIPFEIVESSDNKKFKIVGKCEISNLPPGLEIGTEIDVEFHLNPRGTISVWTESAATGQRIPIAIQRKGVMSPNQRKEWKQWLETGFLCEDME